MAATTITSTSTLTATGPNCLEDSEPALGVTQDGVAAVSCAAETPLLPAGNDLESLAEGGSVVNTALSFATNVSSNGSNCIFNSNSNNISSSGVVGSNFSGPNFNNALGMTNAAVNNISNTPGDITTNINSTNSFAAVNNSIAVNNSFTNNTMDHFGIMDHNINSNSSSGSYLHGDGATTLDTVMDVDSVPECGGGADPAAGVPLQPSEDSMLSGDGAGDDCSGSEDTSASGNYDQQQTDGGGPPATNMTTTPKKDRPAKKVSL